MAKEWDDEEIEFLKANAGSKTIPDLARRLDTTSPEVSRKLVELGLAGSDSNDRLKLYDDPLVDAYGKALQHLQKGKFKMAAKALEKIAAETDLPELAERARQMLRVCDAQTGKDLKDEVDPFLLAVYEKNRGNFEEALKICRKGDRLKKDERFLFLAASIHALEERADEAAAALTRAVELNPKNRIYAFHDPDFALLRDEPDHAAIFNPPA